MVCTCALRELIFSGAADIYEFVIEEKRNTVLSG